MQTGFSNVINTPEEEKLARDVSKLVSSCIRMRNKNENTEDNNMVINEQLPKIITETSTISELETMHVDAEDNNMVIDV